MNDIPAVHVIAVGDELRSGRRQDTNGPWMARQLAAIGMPPAQLHVAGDDPRDLAALLRHVAQDARLLVLCGGLGPTGDDTTRQALSLAAEKRGWSVSWYDPKTVFGEAAAAIGENDISGYISNLGRSIGPPWQARHKLAAAAALATGSKS